MTLQPFDYVIEDTFVKYNTRSLLCGKTFTEYHKRVLLEIIKYYASKEFKGNTETEQRIIEYVQKVFDAKPDVSYDELMRLFHATSNECMLAYILVAYNNENISIILHCMYTFCRVLPFNSSTEWYDNYRLNNYGHPLNMIMWNDYDNDDTYTIDRKFPNDINPNVQLDYKRIVKRLVGPLRAFIIDHGLYPTQGSKSTSMPTSKAIARSSGTSVNMLNSKRGRGRQSPKPKPKQSTAIDYFKYIDQKYNRRRNKLTRKGVVGGDVEAYTTDASVTPFRASKQDKLSRNLTAEQICDECYQHYPYFFVGAHGCDVFDTYLSPNIDELTLFFERYPSAKVGYILNTATYASGKGEHWVALELSKGKAKLVCSQASDFGGFHDDGRLYQTLQRKLYGLEHNVVRFQSDSYSCGIFSALSLYKMLVTGSIEKAVDEIGTNGESLKTGMDINDIRAIWAGTTTTRFD